MHKHYCCCTLAAESVSSRQNIMHGEACTAVLCACSEVSACQARISALEAELSAAAAEHSSRLAEQQKAFLCKVGQLRQVHNQQVAAAIREAKVSGAGRGLWLSATPWAQQHWLERRHCTGSCHSTTSCCSTGCTALAACLLAPSTGPVNGCICCRNLTSVLTCCVCALCCCTAETAGSAQHTQQAPRGAAHTSNAADSTAGGKQPALCSAG